jgi:3-phenylpropionate/trans-cinnamate dioxygenase ferredoxin subunit
MIVNKEGEYEVARFPDGTIQCAWHGARFDCTTGEVRQGPALRPLPVFEVRMDGDSVLVGPQVNQGAEAT